MVGKDIKIIYIESMARVHHLSRTGRIVYPFVDRFIVQWSFLLKSYPGAEYLAQLL
jgi:beta-1,4-N-acetylglucosaminyltransferase